MDKTDFPTRDRERFGMLQTELEERVLHRTAELENANASCHLPMMKTPRSPQHYAVAKRACA